MGWLLTVTLGLLPVDVVEVDVDVDVELLSADSAAGVAGVDKVDEWTVASTDEFVVLLTES